MRLALLIAVGALSSAAHAEATVASQWKARAFDAMEAMQKLQERIGKVKPGSKEDKRLRIQMVIEAAYMAHLDEKLAPILHSVQGDREFFHLAFNSDGGGLFDLLCIYDRSGNVMGTRIDHLPDGWQVLMARTAPSFLSVMRPGFPMMFFDLNDPLAAFVAPQ